MADISPSRFMIDPSILGSLVGLEWFLTVPDVGSVALPPTFVQIAREGVDSRTRSFFGLRTIERDDLQGVWERVLARLPEMGMADLAEPALEGETWDIHESLRERMPYPVGQILSEEWAFLMTQSWVGSRLLKPFSTFFRHGASHIQVGWRRIAGLTLHLPREVTNQPLTGRQHARAVFKWVAAGGADAIALLGLQGTPVSAVGLLGNFFFLLDP